MAEQSIRVLVVDDSLLFRMTMREVLVKIDGCEVVGSASNGREALQKIEELDPDLLTLDIQMPDIDGIEVLRQIRQRGQRTAAIMVSTLTETGARATTESLLEGAFDFVLKPSAANPQESVALLRTELQGKIDAFRESRRRQSRQPRSSRAATDTSESANALSAPQLVVIGCSTGGPEALRSILPRLPADLPAPILVVQHMPRQFTRTLAARLNELSPLNVAEADDGTVLQPGHVLIAPGGRQIRIRHRSGRLSTLMTDDPPVHGCRPSVDYLLRSVAEILGATTLTVILTGMGRDGTEGCRLIKQKGGTVFTQDEQSSVVFGMPRSIQEAGLSDSVLPLDDVASAIARSCE